MFTQCVYALDVAVVDVCSVSDWLASSLTRRVLLVPWPSAEMQDPACCLCLS